MLLAYDFPLLSASITIFFFMLWVLWLFLLFKIVTDLFRSQDLSGVAKGAWLVFLIFLPYLGVIVYVFSRGDKLAQNELARHQANEERLEAYLRDAAGTGSVATELDRLAGLRDRGVLTDEEFAAQKAKLLA